MEQRLQQGVADNIRFVCKKTGASLWYQNIDNRHVEVEYDLVTANANLNKSLQDSIATNDKENHDSCYHIFPKWCCIFGICLCLSVFSIMVSILPSLVSIFSGTWSFLPQKQSNSDFTNLSKWELSWSDEFNETHINSAVWTMEYLTGLQTGNDEEEIYTASPENCYINTTNDNLILQALKANPPYLGYPYTSCRLNTRGKKSFLYGRILARLRAPKGQGIWPAFWMLGDAINTIAWPSCGEIDIFEMVGGKPWWHGGDNTCCGSFHYTNADQSKCFVSPKGTILNDEFIITAMEWDEMEIRMYANNIMYHRLDISKEAQQFDPSLAAFHQPFFMLLDLAVGGKWPGPPNERTPFPSLFYIDYVRKYHRRK